MPQKAILSAKQKEMLSSLRTWARATLAPQTETRYQNKTIPSDDWAKLAAHGLTAFAKEDDGSEPLRYALASEALVWGSRDLGLGLSWLVSQLLCRYFLRGYGTPAQQALLEAVSKQGRVWALALSEAERGAHPRHLQATATRHPHGWQLNGQKVFCTNGPLADGFIFIAKTHDGGANGKHGFSAFLADAHTLGICVDPMDLPFCQSSPHGIVHFDDVSVPSDALLDKEHGAYEAFIKLFRHIEDSYASSLFVGHLAWMLEELAPLVFAHLPEQAERVGEAFAQLHLARIASYSTACVRETHPLGDTEELLSRNAAQIAISLTSTTLSNLFADLPKSAQSASLKRGVSDLQLGQVANRVRHLIRAQLAKQMLSETPAASDVL